jgi:uncharacterized membrane protein
MKADAESADQIAAPALEEALSEPIVRNISDIIELENRELESTTGAQRWLENASRRIARPAYLIGLLLFVAAWILLNSYAGVLEIPPLDPPPFYWLQGLVTLTALLTTTVVLIGQARQSRLAEQRAHLDLQINLLTEQKVTKLIHLFEELRTDLPGVQQRHDPHVSQLKRPTDAAQLATALKEKDAGNDRTSKTQPEK